MEGASGDGGGGASVAEVDCGSGLVVVVIVSVAELSVLVVSPAGDGSVVEQCAGVLATNRNKRRDTTSCEGNSGTWRITGGCTTDTELTISIFSPTLHRAICC